MVLTQFHQIAKQDSIKIHPMVAHLVDPEILARLSTTIRTAPSDAAGDEPKHLN